MTDWKPGDVALSTFEKVGADPAVGVRPRGNNGWEHSADFGNGAAFDSIGGFTARRLVVIDPDDTEQVKRLADAYAKPNGLDEAGPAITRGITAALREFASPTPPRPDEPTGLGAVVEDSEGADWHRSATGRWIAEDGLRTRAGGWDHVNAVRVLSPGVES